MSISKEFFTVVVLGADSKPVKQLEPQVFALHNGEEYSLQIFNHHPKLKANAKIFIDGKEAVYVRVDNNSSVTVERPSKMLAKFTFVKAMPDGSASFNPDRGILKIDFELEKDIVVVVTVPNGFTSNSITGRGRLEADGGDEVDGPTAVRGQTVFGRSSRQQFEKAKYIETNYCTTIKAIMVVVA